MRRQHEVEHDQGRRFGACFFHAFGAIVRADDSESARLFQLQGEEIDHVGLVLHDQDLFVRRKAHATAGESDYAEGRRLTICESPVAG